MAKHRVDLTHRKLRSILTDMLPFEVPPTFSNRGFFRFLRRHGIEIQNGRLQWISDNNKLDAVISLIFGLKSDSLVKSEVVTEWGKTKAVRFIRWKDCRRDTIPFNFRVSHKLDGRTLSVVHPRNQMAVADFYARYSELITFYTSISAFSIRRPISAARYAYFKDRLHEEKVDLDTSGIEEDEREYEQLGSYFVYKAYRNVHQFFESPKYHRSEKKYTSMVQIDVNKCFDSIYTHSLPWAIMGKAQTKHWLDESKNTFAGHFDDLMQCLNYKETNGIVIGPEFSRIFAEIILQSVDVEVQRRLSDHDGLVHKVDYEVFRYVDDYFIFYNSPLVQLQIYEVLQAALKSKKLSINSAKIKYYDKPIITELTIAKERISSLLASEINFACREQPGSTPSETTKELDCTISSSRIIVKFKTIVKETEVIFGDILNYTFAIIESKSRELFRAFNSCDKNERDRKHLLKSMLSIAEFSFFIYSASPKVNHTVRICRIITSSIDFLRSKHLRPELKHLYFQYIHDNILQQIEKNTMSSHCEVENLYLFTALSQIGKDYRLPEGTLLRHFLIEVSGAGSYSRSEFMNHFSITVLLSYIGNRVRYSKLRQFIEEHVIEKMRHVKANCLIDSEAIVLLLDLIVCPYFNDATKAKIGSFFGLDAAGVASLRDVHDCWFTVWGEKFNLGKELDAKLSREVY